MNFARKSGFFYFLSTNFHHFVRNINSCNVLRLKILKAFIPTSPVPVAISIICLGSYGFNVFSALFRQIRAMPHDIISLNLSYCPEIVLNILDNCGVLSSAVVRFYFGIVGDASFCS